MKKTAFAALGLILALTLCILGACTKTDAAKAAGETEAATGQAVQAAGQDGGFVPSQVVHVRPAVGLNLRESAGSSGRVIRTLEQVQRLVILEKGQNEETIGGAKNFWYRVDTGSEKGWVFGAHLVSMSDEKNYEQPDVCAATFPLEREVILYKEGMAEPPQTWKRAVSGRYGYVIYLPPGELGKLTRAGEYDFWGSNWFNMWISPVRPGTRVPPDQTFEERGLSTWTEYKRVTVGNRTLQVELNYWHEAACGGVVDLYEMVNSIRSVLEKEVILGSY
jgi:hypothetical protein